MQGAQEVDAGLEARIQRPEAPDVVLLHLHRGIRGELVCQQHARELAAVADAAHAAVVHAEGRLVEQRVEVQFRVEDRLQHLIRGSELSGIRGVTGRLQQAAAQRIAGNPRRRVARVDPMRAVDVAVRCEELLAFSIPRVERGLIGRHAALRSLHVGRYEDALRTVLLRRVAHRSPQRAHDLRQILSGQAGVPPRAEVLPGHVDRLDDRAGRLTDPLHHQRFTRGVRVELVVPRDPDRNRAFHRPLFVPGRPGHAGRNE